jgi:hypothetical protein
LIEQATVFAFHDLETALQIRRDHAAAMHVRFSNEIRDDVGVRRGDVAPLAWIDREVEQERRRVFAPRVALAVGTAGDEMRLVIALANRAKLVVPIVKVDRPGTCAGSGQPISQIDASIRRSDGGSAPANRAAVTKRSIALARSVTTERRTVPGHQKIAGVRTPPSHVGG